MSPIDQSSVGNEASLLESNVERYEQDAEVAQTRTEKLEDVIERVAQDARMVESLRKNQREAREDLEEAQQLHDKLASETSSLMSQLHEQMEALSSERETLLQLEAVGEDVSGAMGVLDDRQAWLEQCEEQMMRIGDRLDLALDVYDISDSSASGVTNAEASSEHAETPRSKSAADGQSIGDASGGEAYMPASDFNLAGASAGLGDMSATSSQDYMKDLKNDAQRASKAAEISRAITGLSATKEPKRQLENGGTIYDSPDEQSDKLNWHQGLYSDKYQGTCGLCSVQNIARMAGKNLSERDVVELARKKSLCDKGLLLQPGERGGTTASKRQKLLSLLGIESHLDEDQSIEHIADLVESGRGVISHVEAWYFWHGAVPFDQAGGHAVVITSVERDATGFPTAFHVCDSGLPAADYRIDSAQFAASLVPVPECALNVTDRIIR